MTPAMKLHENELDIDAALVRRLLAAQFPQWAGLPLEPLPVGGTDNAIFRLGDHLSVRLPKASDRTGGFEKEARWLPVLAPQLPLAIPTPVALGQPGEGYPCAWAVHEWLEGDDATDAALDLAAAASDLAAFLAALHRIATTEAPSPGGRGGPLAPRDPHVREAIAALGDLIDPDRVSAVWETSLAAPEWDRPPVWIHGDLDLRNLLVDGGRITAVLDWGATCTGDPACDVKVAWAILDRETRPFFRERLAIDDATWARARGWAISQSLIALPYYLHTYPAIVEQAWRWLREALEPD